MDVVAGTGRTGQQVYQPVPSSLVETEDSLINAALHLLRRSRFSSVRCSHIISIAYDAVGRLLMSNNLRAIRSDKCRMFLIVAVASRALRQRSDPRRVQ